MLLAPGTRLGPYEIVAPIGAGGMGKPGTVTLRVDNTEHAKGRVEKTTPFRVSTRETLDCGEDSGTPVYLSYDVPFRFKGELGKIVLDLK